MLGKALLGGLLKVKNGFMSLMEKTVDFFVKYSDDILKVLGASALVALLVKILKEYIAQTAKDKEEVDKILEEVKREKELTPELKKKLDALSEKNVLLKNKIKKGLEEAVEAELENRRKKTQKIKEADMVWFATANGLDNEKLRKIQEDATLVLYGQADDNGIAVELSPDSIDDENLRQAFITVNEFCNQYCEVGTRVYIADGLLDEENTDNVDELGYFAVENGVYFNFMNSVNVTEVFREQLSKVLSALNVLVADISDTNPDGKYYSEYFLE